MLAVVTGAGVRVGRAIAIALAHDGFDVVVHANRSHAAAEETAKEIRAIGRAAFVEQADLTDEAALGALARRVRALSPNGAVDVLVHSAAGFEKVPFAQITREQWRAMLALNLEAPFFLTQALLPALQRASAPCVIHIVDIGAERAMNGYAHYSVSKAGIAMLTKALAVELGPGIRVCGVAPGAVAFPASFTAEQREGAIKRIPLKREGTPEDVARAVVFLAHAPYMSGCIVPVDGGDGARL